MTFILLPVVLTVIVVFGLRLLRRGADVVALVAMLSWAAVVSSLAQGGVLAKFDVMPPKLPLVAISAVGLALLVGRVGVVKEALRAMPDWWAVALQTFRFPLELGLYGLFAAGQLPEQMTFAGQNFDVLVGLTAPLAAYFIATKQLPRWAQWAWQAFAIALLVNVLRIAITSAPGPLHASWPGAPLTIVAQWPYALLPGFLVPLAVLGHVVAISKLLQRKDASAQPLRGS